MAGSVTESECVAGSVPGYPYWAMVLAPTAIYGYLRTLYAQAVEIPSEATEALCRAAKEAGIHVVMGLNEREGGTLYNGQRFLGPDGRILGRRRKLVPTSHERLVWGRGDGADLALFDTSLGKLPAGRRPFRDRHAARRLPRGSDGSG